MAAAVAGTAAVEHNAGPAAISPPLLSLSSSGKFNLR